MLVAIGVLLADFVDEANKLVKREKRSVRYRDAFRDWHKDGTNDNIIVDLSFFNVSDNTGIPDPEQPNKVIFDKNDPNGRILPVLFPNNTPGASVCLILRNGVPFVGHSTSIAGTRVPQDGLLGTMECIHNDMYSIYIKEPSRIIMAELNSRNIQVISGNQPLRSQVVNVMSSDDTAHARRYAQIYANRRDAVGVFNPNDTSILPR